MLNQLLSVPFDARDEKWVDDFLKEFIGTNIQLLSPDPQEGPDGFPYLMASTDKGDEPSRDVITWAAQKGIGLAVNPQKEIADFVFTYGMLWNFAIRGEFFTAETPTEKGQIILRDKQELFAGAPAETFWPPFARQIFKEFLMQQGILQGRFILLSEKENGPMDLAFSLESLQNPPEPEWDGILEGFSWFFPSHYSLALVSEKNISGMKFLDI